jgi:hypothetical protein
MYHTITNTNNTSNLNTSITNTPLPSIGAYSMNDSIKSDKKGLNMRLINAVGGYILEVDRNVPLDVLINGHAANTTRYILREKNIGRQIEKILALELLKG